MESVQRCPNPNFCHRNIVHDCSNPQFIHTTYCQKTVSGPNGTSVVTQQSTIITPPITPAFDYNNVTHVIDTLNMQNYSLRVINLIPFFKGTLHNK